MPQEYPYGYAQVAVRCGKSTEVRVVERNEKSREWLLKDQERRLNKIDEMFNEYSKLNVVIENIKKMVADLVLEEKRVDDQMTSLRYKITNEEKKVREINKMLRSNEDPTRMPKGEKNE